MPYAMIKLGKTFSQVQTKNKSKNKTPTIEKAKKKVKVVNCKKKQNISEVL